LAVDREELDSLSTKELHDRAMSVARHRLDVGFLWRLIKTIPPAEAAAGELDDANVDIVSLTSLLTDTITSGEGELGEALRPLYVEYLAEHGGSPAAPS
jgi:hypothetical protein